MKRIPNGRRLKVGDRIYVLEHPEFGECIITEILKNINAGCYIRTFYRLQWKDMLRYDVDLFLFQELATED